MKDVILEETPEKHRPVHEMVTMLKAQDVPKSSTFANSWTNFR